MTPERIEELLEPYIGPPAAYRLPPVDLQDISTYIDILLRWNARVNLTAIRQPDQIVTRHFGESFFAARHLFPNRVETGASPVLPQRSEAASEQGTVGPKESHGDSARGVAGITVADVGSGAGFPGIPIKLWAPSISLTLIESNHKKAMFLREVVRALTLTDVDIRNVRAEALADARFDVVTLRAVERFESILHIAASLLSPGGRLALLIGQAQLPMAQSILPALEWSAFPIPQSAARVMVIATALAKDLRKESRR